MTKWQVVAASVVCLGLVADRAPAQTCTYHVTPSSATPAASGGNSSVSITPSADTCAWTASAPPWIVLESIARPYARQVQIDSPAGYWRLNETSGTAAADLTGHGYSGTYSGGFALSQSGPLADGDRATSFDGIDGNVTIADASALRFTSALTVEAWIRFTSANYGAIVAKYSGGNGYFLAYDSNLNRIRWYGGSSSGNGTAFQLWSTSSLRDGGWHHLVATYDGMTGAAALYIDGTTNASSTGGPASITTTAHALQISAGWSDGMFTGRIDDVAVYDHALTAAQAAAHYAARNATGPDTLAYTATPNPFPTSRTGTLTIAGQSVGVTQTGRSCAATTWPADASFDIYAASGTVDVFTTPGCAWSASSNAGWITPGSTVAGYAKSVMADAPAGYWRLDEGAGSYAADSSGHDRIGVYSGGVTFGAGGTVGDRDTATLFDGSTAALTLRNSSAFEFTTALSIEAWVKFTAAANGPIVAKYDSAGGYVLMHDLLNNKLRFYGKGGSNTAFQVWSPSHLRDGVRHHIVATYDGGTGVAVMYIDGNAAASSTGSAPTLWTTTQPLQIGRWFAGESFAGTIDEVAVYDRALTPAQVAQHWAARGLGADRLTYNIAATTTSLTRSGTLTVAGQSTGVLQLGRTCTYSIDASSANPDAAGGAATVALTTFDACAWTATSNNPDWITITTPSGASAATVGYRVAANTTPSSRTGTFMVAGRTVTVRQAACGYTLSATNPSIAAGPAVDTISVTTAASCTWTATAASPWLRLTSPDSYADSVLSDAPTAYWRLNEISGSVAADATGHGHDGAYVGGTTLGGSGTTGDDDFAARFDGATGHVTVPHDNALNFTGAITVEAWIAFNHAAWSNYGPIVAKRGPGEGGYFLIRDYPSGQIRWQGITVADTNVFGVWSPGVPDDGGWHHLVGTYSASLGAAVLYLDGVAVSTASGSASIPPSTVPLEIAAWANNADTFNGATDDVAIYDHALTPAQVAQHFNSRGAVPTMTGSGTIAFAARANARTTARTGILTIAAQTVLVEQAGAVCTALVTPSTISAVAGDSAGVVTVSVPDGCTWDASATHEWIAVNAAIPYQSRVLMDEPVGYWRLDEGSGTHAWDSSGMDANGTYTAGVAQDQHGALGDGDTAARFDGLVESYGSGVVDLGTNAAFALTDDLSVEAWVKYTYHEYTGPIVSKYSSGGAGFFLMEDSLAQRLRWQVRRTADSDVTALWSPASLEDGAWHHVVGTYNAGTGASSLYADGALVASVTKGPSPLTTSAEPLRIGGWFNEMRFNGTIDEVAIYDHALTAAQVSQHYAARGVGAVDLVEYTVRQNVVTVPRTGAMTVAGETVTVNQDAAPCTYQLSAATSYAWWWNAIASFTVTTSSNCTWTTALPNVPWVALQTSNSTAYPDQIVADGATGYWRLNEISGTAAEDASGNTHTGTYVGSVSRWYGGALSNGDASANFDGAGANVSMGNVPAFNFTSDVSVEAWVAFTDHTDQAYGPIISKATGSAGYFLVREIATGKLRWSSVASWGAGIFALHTPTNINNGLWHHVVGTYSTTTGVAALYVDGVLVNSASGLSAAIATSTQAFEIGAWGNDNDTFNGSIDDVAVYDRALTAAQVAAHYGLRSEAVTGSGTVWYYLQRNPSDEERTVAFSVAGHTETLWQVGSIPWMTINGLSAPETVPVHSDGTVQVVVGDPHGSPYDVVRLFHHGDPDSAYIDAQYVTGGKTLSSAGTREATLVFPIPETPGEYDLRLFTENHQEHVAVAPMIVANGPIITLNAPLPYSQFTAGDAVMLTAGAADWGGVVSRVDFYVDGILVGSASSPPWQHQWTASAGATALTALATDSNSRHATSNTVVVSVSGGSSSTGGDGTSGGGGGGGSGDAGSSGGGGFTGSLTVWNTFSADIRITRGREGADVAAALAEEQTTDYHLERALTFGSWHSVMTYRGSSTSSVMTLNGETQQPTDFGVARIEDDGNGSPARYYDLQGNVVEVPSDPWLEQRGFSPLSAPGSSGGPSTSADWVKAIVISPSERDDRLQTFDARLGSRVGVVDGLDRHVVARGAIEWEVLVNPDTGVPAEINSSVGGNLQSHTAFAYTTGDGGYLVRSSTRTEQLIGDGTGDRAVTTIRFSNIRLEQR